MKITIPALRVTLDDNPTLEQIKAAAMVQDEEVEGKVVPCYPNGRTKMFASVVADVPISYWGSEQSANNHLDRIDKYFKNGGTFTSVMVLSIV